MKEKTSDFYQIGLLLLVISLLVTNLAFFLRLNRTQSEILTAIRHLHGQGEHASPAQALAPGTPAPPFLLPSLGGGEVSLDQFQGDRVLLFFSSVDCPACDRVYPAIKRVSQGYPDQKVLMISRGTSAENQALWEKEEFPFPIAFWDDAVARSYRVPGTPFGVVVDHLGVVLGSGIMGSEEALAELISIAVPTGVD